MWKRLRSCFACGRQDSRSTSPEKLTNVSSDSETGRDTPEYAQQESTSKKNRGKRNDGPSFGHKNEGAQELIQNEENQQRESLRHRTSATNSVQLEQDAKEETKANAKLGNDVIQGASEAVHRRVHDESIDQLSPKCESREEEKLGQLVESISTETKAISKTNNVESTLKTCAKRSIFDRFEITESNEELAHPVEEKFGQQDPAGSVKDTSSIQEEANVNNGICSLRESPTASCSVQKVIEDVVVEQVHVSEAQATETVKFQGDNCIQVEDEGGNSENKEDGHEFIKYKQVQTNSGGSNNDYCEVAISEFASSRVIESANRIEKSVNGIDKDCSNEEVDLSVPHSATKDGDVNNAVAKIASLEQHLNENVDVEEINEPTVQDDVENNEQHKDASMNETSAAPLEVRSGNLVEEFSDRLSKSILNAVLQNSELPANRSDVDQNRAQSVLQFSERLAESIVRSVVYYAKHEHLSEHDDHEHLSPNVAAHATNNEENATESSLAHEDDVLSTDETHDENCYKNLQDYAKQLSQKILSDVLDMQGQSKRSTEVYASNLTQNIFSRAINGAKYQVNDSHSLPDSDIGIESALDLFVAEIVGNAVEEAFSKVAMGNEMGSHEQSGIGDLGDQRVIRGDLQDHADNLVNRDGHLGLQNRNGECQDISNADNEQGGGNGEQHIGEYIGNFEGRAMERKDQLRSSAVATDSGTTDTSSQKHGTFQSKCLSKEDLDELDHDNVSDEDEGVTNKASVSVSNSANDDKPGVNGLSVHNSEKQSWRQSLIDDLVEDFCDEEETIADELLLGEDTANRPSSAANSGTVDIEPLTSPNNLTTPNDEKQFWRKSLIEDLNDELDEMGFDETETPRSSTSSSPIRVSNLDDFARDESVDSDDEVLESSSDVKVRAPLVHDSSRSRLRSVDSTPVLVLDNGSAFLKVGFSDQPLPKEVVSSVVGTPLRYSQVISGMEYSASPGLVFGSHAMAKAGVLHIEYPLKPDLIERWSDVQGLWDHVLSAMMSIPDNPDFPVLISQPGLNPRKNTEKIAEIMFEHFRMPSLFIADQLALSLFSMGYTSGLSFTSGFKHTQAGVVYEGHVLPHTVKQLDISGYQLTENLKKLLMSLKGFGFRSSSQWQIVDDIKKKLGFFSLDFETDANKYKTQAELQTPYELPDGQVIEVGLERCGCTESMFRPMEVGLTQSPAHMLIVDAIQSCEVELQELSYKAMGVSGGTTLMNGFLPRLEQELRKVDRRFKYFTAPEQRALSTWLGGSVVASLPTFGEMVVTVDEYAESGPRVVHSKCF